MSLLRRFLPRVAIAFFTFLFLLSLWAGLVGIDPDARWGLLRQTAFAIGAAGLLCTACLEGIRALDRRLVSRRSALDDKELERLHPSSTQDVSTHASAPPLVRPYRRWISLLSVTGLVAITGVTYVGLETVWRWTEWPATTRYYAMLGHSFTEGKTYLPIEPSPVLSRLENPYSPAARSQYASIGNLSYYEGRYYMYWGPAPAVGLAILEFLGAPAMGDEAVVFVAVSLVFLFSAMVVMRLEHVYFEGLPLWLIIAGLVVVATIHPMLWFQSSPSILTAAIASGQAFLLGGAYFLVRALTDEDAQVWLYATAGALWALAMTSRLTTAPSVIILVLGASILSLKRARMEDNLKTEAVRMGSLLGALILVMSVYGWYNLIRFDSPFETGFRFQFTEFDKNAQLARGSLFSIGYVIPNTLYYFLAPVRLVSRFPYLRAVYGESALLTPILSRFQVPADYRVEDATGLVFATPTFLFAITYARLCLYGKTSLEARMNTPATDTAGRSLPSKGALGSTMLMSGLAGIPAVLLYCYSTTRYELDFVPMLAIVAVLGMWHMYRDTRPYPIQSRLATGLIVSSVTAATLVSLLLAVSGAGSSFDDVNPALYSFLVNFLPHW